MCVDDPKVNGIARSLLNKGAWEAWLSKHLVKAMLNYPNAVLIGKFSPRVVRGKTVHFLDFAAFDQIKIIINQIFRCASKHSIY